MAADTGMTEKQKRAALRRLTQLSTGAYVLIDSGKRSPEQVDALLEALQAFKEDQLAGSVRSQPNANVEKIIAACNLEVANVALDKRTKRMLREKGIRYVGEVYYVELASTRQYKLSERWSAMLEVFKDELGIPRDCDPLLLGWNPVYWEDELFLGALTVTLLELYPTRPMDWEWVKSARCDPFAYLRNRTPARYRHFNDGIGFVGQFLIRPREVMDLWWIDCCQKELERDEITLWAGALLPFTFTFPDYSETELWGLEIEMVLEEEEIAKQIIAEWKQEIEDR